jgi:hypothetical protein
MTEWLGWHFLPEDRRLANGDGREVVVGETYTVEGEPVLCEHGLHASKRAIDALHYAPGPVVCRVRLSGTIVEGDDKACATERTVLGMADATRTLHEFAMWCAEGALKRANVTDERCWQALEVKRKWLDGGATNEELVAARDAARDAARAAAWAAAWDAAEAAARAAAWAAAWDAARDAAEAAARAAARDEQNAELERRLLALVGAAAGESAHGGRQAWLWADIKWLPRYLAVNLKNAKEPTP